MGAEGFAPFASRCPCGAALTQPATGRPRRTCSDACRRKLDHLRRKRRRREAWRAEWLRLAAVGRITQTQARLEVAALDRDLRMMGPA